MEAPNVERSTANVQRLAGRLFVSSPAPAGTATELQQEGH